MIVIGICGASGSGKSTLAEELCRAIGKGSLVINHDCYYRDHPSLTFEERSLLNYDEPEIFDHDLFLEDVCGIWHSLERCIVHLSFLAGRFFAGTGYPGAGSSVDIHCFKGSYLSLYSI